MHGYGHGYGPERSSGPGARMFKLDSGFPRNIKT